MDIATRKTSLGWTIPCSTCAGPVAGHNALGSLDPARTAALVTGSALGSAVLPATIGVILAATKHPNGAKAAFIIAGIFAAVGAAGGIFAAQTYAETMKGEL